MKKIRILLLLAALSPGVRKISAQGYCGTSEIMVQAPAFEKKRQADHFAKEYANTSHKKNAASYIIPVVFHVLHNNGKENISDDQINDAVRILNESFRKQNADTVDIIPEFQAVAADCEIEFKLAKKDPLGNTTTGIERIETTLTYKAKDSVAKLNPWDRSKYLNIWVVSSTYSGNAAFAYMPYYADSLPLRDGIMIIASYVGSIGTSNKQKSSALVHEIGHYLNLYHPWSSGLGLDPVGTNCGNDEVDDTPITKGWLTCNLTASQCDAGIIENVQNFMEYAYCSKMFTYGQKTRMHAALNFTMAERNNLWTTENLIATGLDAEAAIADNGNESELFSIYPNPSNGEFSIAVSSELKKSGTLSIYDITGRTVTKIDMENVGKKTDLNLNKGVYFVHFQKNDLSHSVKKLIIQ